MPTSDDLMRLARACANRITPPRKSRQFPSFSEVEEQCEEEYEELLSVLHDDEVYQSADLSVQEQLVEAIRAALPEIRHVLLEDLVDNQAAQVWLQQEGAYHVGLAVGTRLRLKQCTTSTTTSSLVSRCSATSSRSLPTTVA